MNEYPKNSDEFISYIDNMFQKISKELINLNKINKNSFDSIIVSMVLLKYSEEIEKNIIKKQTTKQDLDKYFSIRKMIKESIEFEGDVLV